MSTDSALAPGALVYLPDNTVGELVQVKPRRVQVRRGRSVMWLHRDRVEPVHHPIEQPGPIPHEPL